MNTLFRYNGRLLLNFVTWHLTSDVIKTLVECYRQKVLSVVLVRRTLLDFHRFTNRQLLQFSLRTSACVCERDLSFLTSLSHFRRCFCGSCQAAAPALARRAFKSWAVVGLVFFMKLILDWICLSGDLNFPRFEWAAQASRGLFVVWRLVSHSNAQKTSFAHL